MSAVGLESCMFARLFFALLLVLGAIFSAFMFVVGIFIFDSTCVILWIVAAALEMLLAVFLGVRAVSDREADEQDKESPED